MATERRLQISHVEVEIPLPPGRFLQFSHVELEVPEPTPRALDVSRVELETPDPLPRFLQIARVELEVSDVAPRTLQISQIELEIPEVSPRFLQISRVELEIPGVEERLIQVSNVALEIPNVGTVDPPGPRFLQFSNIALEIPGSDPRFEQISRIELEIPDVQPRLLQLSRVELELPDLQPRFLQIGRVELEIPADEPRELQVSYVALEVPTPEPRWLQVSSIVLEIPAPAVRFLQLSRVELEVPLEVFGAVSDLRRLLGDFTHLEFGESEVRGFLAQGAQEMARRGLLIQAQEVIHLQSGQVAYALDARWVQTFAVLQQESPGVVTHDPLPKRFLQLSRVEFEVPEVGVTPTPNPRFLQLSRVEFEVPAPLVSGLPDEVARSLTLVQPEAFGRFGRIEPTIPPGPPQAVTIWQGRLWVSPIPNGEYILDHKYFALPVLADHEQVYEVPQAFLRLPIWHALAVALRAQGKLEPSLAVMRFFDQLVGLYASIYRASARDSTDESAMPR